MSRRRFDVRSSVLAVCAACVFATTEVASAQGNDDLYEVTVKMEMAGMPMAMPPMVQQQCVRKGASDADYVPQRENCRVSDAVRSGARLTFKLVCTGSQAMTGAGDFTFVSDGYNGQMRMKAAIDGQSVDMTQTVSARRVGVCTAAK